MRVLKDRLLIERCKREPEDGKAVIIRLDKPPLNIFEVLDVGPDVLGVFQGDKIMVEPYAIAQLEGEEYADIYVIHDKQILVVL